MGWNRLSIPKFQRYNHWNLAMDKNFHITLSWEFDYSSLLGLKSIHVTKRLPGRHAITRTNAGHVNLAQRAKTIGLISIRLRPDTFVSDRGLIDVDPKVLAISEVSVYIPRPNSLVQTVHEENHWELHMNLPEYKSSSSQRNPSGKAPLNRLWDDSNVWLAAS